MFNTLHNFVQRRVEVPKEDLPPISVRDGATALVAVVIAELTVFLCLYFLFVPKPTANVTLYTVNATQALAGMDGCDVWTDVTQYPVDGLPLPRLSRIIDVRLTGPVTNTTIMEALPKLTCVGPTDPEAEELGLNIMLGVDAYGWQGYSGRVESLCTHPSLSTLLVRNLATAWDQSCYAALGRARTYYSGLLRRNPNVTDPPELLGIECSMNMAIPVRGQLRYFFHWPQFRSRWGISGWLMFFCDGLVGVQQDFLVNNKRAMTNDEIALLNTSAGLCGRSFNGTCLRSYRRQRWGRGAEFIRLEPARLQCASILNAYTGRSDPSWAPGCNRNINGEQIYFQDPSPGHFTPPNGTFFEGDPTLAIRLLQELSAIPEGQSPSLQNMPSSCPGRTSNVWDLIGPSDTNLKEVQLLLQAYGKMPLFSYSCTRYSPATFTERVAYIFPYINLAHALAMTYLIRYLYLGLRTTNEYLGGAAPSYRDPKEDVEGGLGTPRADLELEEEPRGCGGPKDPLEEFEAVLDLLSPRLAPGPTPRDRSLHPALPPGSSSSRAPPEGGVQEDLLSPSLPPRPMLGDRSLHSAVPCDSPCVRALPVGKMVEL